MDYRPQFPFWFLVGLLLSGAALAFLAFLKALLEGVGTGIADNDWRMMLVESAPSAILGLAGLGVLVGVWMWRRSR